MTNAVEVVTFTGEKLLYDDEAHRYTTLDGLPLLGGSTYAEHFGEPFDRDLWLGRTAKKLKVPVDQVAAAWDLRGDVSRTFGTALHKAMECYFKHKDIGYGLQKHPFLKNAVWTYPDRDVPTHSEVMVSDLSRRMVGQIDGLQVVGTRQGVLIDFKSDASVEKNLTRHSHQLSFYADILEHHGWEVPKLIIWNYTDRWEQYALERMPIVEKYLLPAGG